jgi:hypothetical protein
MTGAMVIFLAAVGATSAVYLLLTRLRYRRVSRTSPSDGSSGDGGNFSDSDGWSLGSWFGHSTAHDSNSGAGSDGGSGDSGGSDCGGGGGGGDGGGGD